MTKKNALGKGLSALLPANDDLTALQSGERVQMITLAQLHANPLQPRQEFDADKLQELAESILQHGVMQPLLVVKDDKDNYRIVAGERRFRAASLAGLKEVPCLVRDLDPRTVSELSLIENIQREDLSPLEEANAMAALIESYAYTQDDLAQRLGKSRPHVANTLRLLKLSPQEKKLLAEGRISAGHARALLSLTGVHDRAKLCSAIITRGLSVRQAEDLAAQMKKQTAPSSPRSQKDLLHADIAKQISSVIGVPVRFTGSADKGRLVIEFNSEDDLQNIIDAVLR